MSILNKKDNAEEQTRKDAKRKVIVQDYVERFTNIIIGDSRPRLVIMVIEVGTNMLMWARFQLLANGEEAEWDKLKMQIVENL